MSDVKLSKIELPKKVIIGECWARDGLQNETKFIPTDAKVDMINRIQDIGFKKIEVTNFAHPKYLPQFRDAEEVLKRVKRKPGVDFRAIVTNDKGMERAIRAKENGYGVQEVAFVISASEPHNKANVGMTHAENKPLIEKMCKMATDNDIDIVAWVLTAFGCAINGDTPLDVARDLGNWWKDMGATYIGFGDTTGESNPLKVYEFYEYMKAHGFTTDEIIVHWHDSRGVGQAKNVAALQCGMKYFDSSLGAIGGQPAVVGGKVYHKGFSGNCCTEDMVCMFEEMGVDTGIDIEAMLYTGRLAETLVGRPLRSNVTRCGPVRHRPGTDAEVWAPKEEALTWGIEHKVLDIFGKGDQK